MADPSRESLINGTNGMPLDEELTEALPEQQTQAPKLKGRKRLLHGLQRMSSSQSLLRLHKSSSSGYRGTGKGSISCISLNSASASYGHPLGSSHGSPFPNGYSTAPTSGPTTPGGLDTPFVAEPSRIRFVTSDGQAVPTKSPTSANPFKEVKTISRPTTSAEADAGKDYFSYHTPTVKAQQSRPDFNFWQDMPAELCGQILQSLRPKEIVRCSRVSKAWHTMCFDGQLWAILDTGDFYRDIPADALVNIIIKAGPFARDLNLRGCVQLWDRWRTMSLADSCTNLENISLEGCRIDRSTIHSLLYQNARLVHINVSGLGVITNTTLKIISQQCPRLEHLNVSWCPNMDTRGLQQVVERCHSLRDLRAGEIRGFENKDIMDALFQQNTLESLVLMNCDMLTEEALTVLMEGVGSEKDFLTGIAVVPPRRLKHLDISRCPLIGDGGLLSLCEHVPDLEGLQLAHNSNITDLSLHEVLKSTPNLTHLDVEELDQLTNATLHSLANSPCRITLQHLSVSYCENLGDVGMLPVITHCTALRSLELDNTRISDLVLIEAASVVRARPRAPMQIDPSSGRAVPSIGLNLDVYDCQNVTWTGIREILARNSEVRTRPREIPRARVDPLLTLSRPAPILSITPSDPLSPYPPIYPTSIINLKVFYGYQPTVTEHTRRVLRGDFPAAARLERKWAEYMLVSEEAGAPGGFGPGGFGLLTGVVGRRRRRRMREAAMMHADEEGEAADAAESLAGVAGSSVGRRRRARSGGGCAVM